MAHAVWALNNDFFSNLKGAGRLRIVLLIRPDIFASLGLQNLNTKSRENSVFLDWRTDYKTFRDSGIFKVIDHLIAAQHVGTLNIGEAWDHYFPWNAPDLTGKFTGSTSFISFLRYSYYRPRDIITMLKILQDLVIARGNNKEVLLADSFDDPAFKREYSEYLLGEIRDQLFFYYSRSDYEYFLKFFTFLRGRGSFSFQQYVHSFESFTEEAFPENAGRPEFMLNARVFLQFLYDLNVICYIDETESDGEYIRWCFRERSYGNISPKVREGVNYRVFIGLYKALNLGQAIVPAYQVGRPVDLQASGGRRRQRRNPKSE